MSHLRHRISLEQVRSATEGLVAHLEAEVAQVQHGQHESSGSATNGVENHEAEAEQDEGAEEEDEEEEDEDSEDVSSLRNAPNFMAHFYYLPGCRNYHGAANKVSRLPVRLSTIHKTCSLRVRIAIRNQPSRTQPQRSTSGPFTTPTKSTAFTYFVMPILTFLCSTPATTAIFDNGIHTQRERQCYKITSHSSAFRVRCTSWPEAVRG